MSDSLRPLSDGKAASDMIEAFASVGVKAFDVTLLDIDEAKKGFQVCSTAELKRGLPERLEKATQAQLNVIIRPRATEALLVQLDDLDAAKVGKLACYAFMTVKTSANNFQVWVAIADGPKDDGRKDEAKQFRKRLRKGAGADTSATGAVRMAGSLNFKRKYAPDFPMVKVSQAQPGQRVTVAVLDAAGLIAAEEAVTPAAGAVPVLQPPASRADAPRSWPNYDQALRGAPMKDGERDRSLADFMWAKWAAQRGWQANEIAYKLAGVSEKARERALKGDHGYAMLTATNAVKAEERERGNRPGRALRL
jgi:hypothetical protein